MKSEIAQEIIHKLGLEILPHEGGYFHQTYISRHKVLSKCLPDDYQGDRAFSTAIYYFLTNETNCFSAFHRLKTDEIYHYYLGDPVKLVLLYPDGVVKIIILGQDILNGQHVQVIVPAGVWQGAKLVEGGKYALLGTTMAPAFDPNDFELGNRVILINKYPKAIGLITELTR